VVVYSTWTALIQNVVAVLHSNAQYWNACPGADADDLVAHPP
jgi:hypothetical protein